MMMIMTATMKWLDFFFLFRAHRGKRSRNCQRQMMMMALRRDIKLRSSLPLLEHVLCSLNLFRCSGDGNDAICRSGKCFINLDESIGLRTNTTNATAALANDSSSQLWKEKGNPWNHILIALIGLIDLHLSEWWPELMSCLHPCYFRSHHHRRCSDYWVQYCCPSWSSFRFRCFRCPCLQSCSMDHRFHHLHPSLGCFHYCRRYEPMGQHSRAFHRFHYHRDDPCFHCHDGH